MDREAFFADLDRMTFGEWVDKYTKSKVHFKGKVKAFLKRGWHAMKYVKFIMHTTRMHPKALYQTVKYSGINNLLHKRGVIFSTHCTTAISSKAHLDLQGLLIFGAKGKFPTSELESRLCIDDGGVLKIRGNVSLGYGCDIEIFNNAELIFHGNKLYKMSGSNIGCTIICGDKIEIGPDVMMGRHVTIRDNNGGHYINCRGYKNTKPVIVGEKAWLCESCTLLSGAKIGVGAVVGAGALVAGKVKAHSMVIGSPAQVVYEDIQWKY